jgi:hypothetical protein
MTITYELALAVLGFIGALGAACTYVSKAVDKVKKPEEEQNKRIEALEKRCDRYDAAFESDKRDIEEIKKVEHLILKTNFALLQHGIDGNNIEPMKKAQEDIQNYLIDK